MREDGRFRLRLAPTHGAQIDEVAVFGGDDRRSVLMRADVDAEYRLVVEHPQECPIAAGRAHGSGGVAVEIHSLRHAAGFVAAHQVAAAPYRHEQGFRVIQLLGDPGVIVPPRMDAVERGSGVDIKPAGLNQGHDAFRWTGVLVAPDRATAGGRRQPPGFGSGTEPSVICRR